MEHEVNKLENLEIVDLQETFVEDTTSFNLDGVDFDNDLFGSFLPDKSLYSRYLNDEITFDELMRQVHHNDTYSTLGDAGVDCDTRIPDPEISSDSCGEDDPPYVPPTNLLRKTKRPVPQTSSATDEPPKAVRKSRWHKRLPVELANYLGEAERCLNVDKFDEAEEICRNIITSNAQTAPPFIVLADIHYRKGNVEKANEFLFEAAIRNPRDVNIWMTLMDFAEEKGDLAIAIYYARLALRAARDNFTIRQRLISYCEKAGRNREALQYRLTALSLSPEANGTAQFQVARSLADEFFKLMDPSSSIRAYEAAFEKYPEDGTDGDKNAALSMMIQLKKYENALKFFLKFCDVLLTTTGRRRSLDISKLTEELQSADQFTKCVVPFAMPNDMRMKLFLVLVRLGFAEATTPHVLKHFTNSLCEDLSDWFIDITKAYNALRLFDTSSTLLLKMTKFKKTSRFPQIWIMLADAYVQQGMTEDAVQAYKHVVNKLSPRNAEVRIALGNLLRRLGRYREALDLLHPANVLPNDQQPDDSTKSSRRRKTSVRSGRRARRKKVSVSDPFCQGTKRVSASSSSSSHYSGTEEDEEEGSSQQATVSWITSVPNNLLLSQDPVAYRLVYERCRMLEQGGVSLAEFMDETWHFLFTDVSRICGSNWAHVIMVLDSARFRSLFMDRLVPKPTDKSDHQPTDEGDDSCPVVSDLDVWSLFLRLVDALVARLPQALPHLKTAAAFGYLLPQLYRDGGRKQAVGNLMISSCFLTRHGTPIFVHLKEIQKQWCHRNQYWNLMNLAITLSRNLRHCRFIERLFCRESSSPAVSILANNDCIVRGSYRYGISRLIALREKQASNPLVLLLLAVGFLSVSMHRHIVSRHPPVLQAFGFLSEYRQIRGTCQEVYYNMGRACHQLMLNNAAKYYYELAINTEPVGETDEERALTDLRMEAAFNLMLIYRSQKNYSMVRHLIQTHLVII